MPYLYQGHLGSLYISDDYLDDDDCYCEECGDYDWNLGRVDSVNDAMRILADDIAILPEDGGWDLDYVLEVLAVWLGRIPSKGQAIKYILAHRTVEQERE